MTRVEKARVAALVASIQTEKDQDKLGQLMVELTELIDLHHRRLNGQQAANQSAA